MTESGASHKALDPRGRLDGAAMKNGSTVVAEKIWIMEVGRRVANTSRRKDTNNYGLDSMHIQVKILERPIIIVIFVIETEVITDIAINV